MDEDERGDAFRGIPKLRFLVVLEYLGDAHAMGIPKLTLLAILEYLGVPWASPSLGSCHSLFHNPSNLYPKLENFTTQNSTGNLMSSVSARKKKPPL